MSLGDNDGGRYDWECPPGPSPDDELGAAIDAAWDGVMVTYTEYDVPGGPGRERSVPGWRCKSCGREVGTSGLPPRACHGCGKEWR